MPPPPQKKCKLCIFCISCSYWKSQSTNHRLFLLQFFVRCWLSLPNKTKLIGKVHIPIGFVHQTFSFSILFLNKNDYDRFEELWFDLEWNWWIVWVIRCRIAYWNQTQKIYPLYTDSTWCLWLCYLVCNKPHIMWSDSHGIGQNKFMSPMGQKVCPNFFLGPCLLGSVRTTGQKTISAIILVHDLDHSAYDINKKYLKY